MEEKGRGEGIIIRLVTRRGFGFLRREDGSDIYFHVSGTLVPWKTLKEGMQVDFAAIIIDPHTGKERAVGVRPKDVTPNGDEEGTKAE